MIAQAVTQPNNLWQTITFAIENIVLSRRLVPHPSDPASELNAACPVGQALLTARPGDQLTAQAPGGPVSVHVINIIPQ